ncbi:MAG: OB-fold putative lipoprotein [Gemmataceae bacterium]|nr:OB-fold putative lipoprotein [Gemmataceae bacterium]
MLARNEFIPSVVCEFPASAQEALAKLRKGQRVTIRGKCKGFPGSVRLDNCSLK